MTLRQATKTAKAYEVLGRQGIPGTLVCWDDNDQLWSCQPVWGGYELVIYGPNLSRADLRASDWTVVGRITTLGD